MTTRDKQAIRYEDALSDPSAHFDHPADVLDASGLTVEQQIEILKRWKQDSIQLMRAADESMTGGEEPHLSEVEKALEELGRHMQNQVDK